MMVGVGLDLCQISRMEEAITHPRFFQRVFSENERQYLASRGKLAGQSAAGLYAAKEAYLKALGTGINTADLASVEIDHDGRGQPYYRRPETGTDAYLSISHDGDTAAAVCVLERQERTGKPTDVDLPPIVAEQGMARVTRQALRWIPPRAADAHKGTAGRVLLYMGSFGMAGAAAMAARAALRAGAGLVTVAAPREIIPVLQTLVPNAMCVPAETLAERIPAHDALAAGCGLGQSPETRAILSHLLAAEKGPAVLDADALNLLAAESFVLPSETALTPHPGEAARLLNVPVEQVLEDVPAAARRLSERFGAVALLKNHVSAAAHGDSVWLQPHGAPSLAKGGSGDALTGILAALCADATVCAGMPDPLLARAALASLWLGLAGEKAMALYGDRSALTGEVIDFLPAVLNEINRE